jgi:hypothetical protein
MLLYALISFILFWITLVQYGNIYLLGRQVKDLEAKLNALKNSDPLSKALGALNSE